MTSFSSTPHHQLQQQKQPLASKPSPVVPITMSSTYVPSYRPTPSPPSSSSRKAVKASASASAPCSRPPTRSSDPFYGHEETSVLCARFVCSRHIWKFFPPVLIIHSRSPLSSNVQISLPPLPQAHLLPLSLTLSPMHCIEPDSHPSSPLPPYYFFVD